MNQRFYLASSFSLNEKIRINLTETDGLKQNLMTSRDGDVSDRTVIGPEVLVKDPRTYT